jgi:hexosaminidase
MNILKTFFFLLLISRVGLAQLIPQPNDIIFNGKSKFELKNNFLVYYQDDSLKNEIEFLTNCIKENTGFNCNLINISNLPVITFYPNSIYFFSNPNMIKNAYELQIDSTIIKITSVNKAATFYAIQTLIQLLPFQKTTNQVFLPCLQIKDAPRFEWRGMHLDVCRHFFPTNFIKKYIDFLAMYKMNVFHWHLTEDQGWRIAIRKYPKLTEIGSIRNGSMVGPYADHRIDSVRYGGYYSQEEIKEIVKYAKQRHITVVPEIEMPGHSLAALAAYPELSCTGGPFEVAKEWGVFDDVYCAGNEETFKFLENVLDEVCELFPGKYIHIGGDECPKTRWKECGKCQKRIKDNNLKDEHELQSYFIQRMEKYLNSKGKQIIGWDEILEGGLAPNATVMSWRGTDGGIAAAQQNHKVVMTPGTHCYFDHYQGNPANEPLAIGGYTPLEKVYSYEPIPKELKINEASLIIGAQGNVWTEYITSSSQVEYMALPRMCALAEVLWTLPENKNETDFLSRLVKNINRLDEKNVNYSKSFMQPGIKVTKANKGINIVLTKPKLQGILKYNLNTGKEKPYNEKNMKITSETETIIHVEKNAELTAYFRLSDSLSSHAKWNQQKIVISKATSKTIKYKNEPNASYSTDAGFTLLNGVRGGLPRLNSEWLAWNENEVEMIIDLEKTQKISEISIGSLENHSNWIWLPTKVEIYTSKDGINFKSSGKTFTGESIWNNKRDFKAKIKKQKTRYIKLIVKKEDNIPKGKPGEGKTAWLFFDEIHIN